MADTLFNWLITHHYSPVLAKALTSMILIIGLILFGALVDVVMKYGVRPILLFLFARVEPYWITLLREHRFFRHLAGIVPPALIYVIAEETLQIQGRLLQVIRQMTLVYIIFGVTIAIFAFLHALVEYYQQENLFTHIPLKNVAQAVQTIMVVIALVLMVSILFDQRPFEILGGLGAFTAVILLIFRDQILGFIAGITIAENKMVITGDWIEMPKYDANGDVIEVALMTVKVRNWDKTITTIPTYALIQESFRNWRGMFESGGRRIKRPIYIDVTSIQFCTTEMLARFRQIEYISDYIEQMESDVTTYNTTYQIDLSHPVNGKRLTNLGTFRAYVMAYLRRHPHLRQDMPVMVRQLEVTPMGIPLEIYTFSAETQWETYEAIQADIFDHLLAIVPEFGLRVFQQPSGTDIRVLLSTSSESE